MIENELLTLIDNYESHIDKGNRLLKKNFKTELPPLIAMRKGIISKSGVINEDFSYNFHGMGCLFTFEKKVLVDFDYSFGDFVYKGFDPFKLHLFIKTYTCIRKSFENIDFLVEVLGKLELKNKIIKKDANDIDTYTFRRIGSE